MSKNFSVAAAIDRNKVASINAFILLIEVIVYDNNGNYVETLRLTKNSENINYRGNLYIAGNFDFDTSSKINEETTFNLTIVDYSRAIQQRMDNYGGGIGFTVNVMIVSTIDLTAPPEIVETLKVISASVNKYIVSFALGIESSVNMRFPPRNQYKERCSWRYKDFKCKYSGGLTSCDFTLNGANGCQTHNNSINFGGFIGINSI
jgi:hypothetical protein